MRWNRDNLSCPTTAQDILNHYLNLGNLDKQVFTMHKEVANCISVDNPVFNLSLKLVNESTRHVRQRYQKIFGNVIRIKSIHIWY